MDKIIKGILKKIEDNGFNAYLVGGYVRDYLLGINSLDVIFVQMLYQKIYINYFLVITIVIIMVDLI